MDNSEILNQVQNNDKTEQNIKDATKSLLEEASFLSENASQYWKNPEEVKKEYELLKEKALFSMAETSEEQQKITIWELTILKKELSLLKWNDNLNTSNSRVDTYVKDLSLLPLEKDKNTVLAVLQKLWDNFSESQKNWASSNLENYYCSLNKINSSLRSDFDIISATRYQNISIMPEEVLLIPDEFFKNPSNLEKLFWICSFNWIVLEKALEVWILTENQILESYIKYKKSSKIGLEMDKIPVKLLEFDVNNRLWLDLKEKQEFLKQNENFKNKKLDLSGISDIRDKADKINLFLQNHNIEDIKPDETLLNLILELNKDNNLQYAENLLLKLWNENNIEFIKSILDKDISIVKYLPYKIRKNSNFQEFYITKLFENKEILNSKEKIENYIWFIELDDIKMAEILYSTLEKLWKKEVLSNPILKEKLNSVLKSNPNSNISKKALFLANWAENILEKSKNISLSLEYIEKDADSKLDFENFSHNLNLKLETKIDDKELEIILKKLIDLKNLQDSDLKWQKLFNELVEKLWDEEKIETLLEEINNYKIHVIKQNSLEITKNLDLKSSEFKVKKEDLESNFDNFYVNKLTELKDQNKTLSNNEIIKEYLEKNSLNITEEKKSEITKLLNNFLENKKNGLWWKTEEVLENQMKLLKWEITKKEYLNWVKLILWEEYDFDAEKDKLEEIEKSDIIPKNNILSQNTISENDNWTYNIKTENWKTIEISKEEKNIVENNKEAMENLINFSEILESLKLKNVWTYRNEIFKAIGNNLFNWFDLEDDYLWKQEINIFLQTVLKSITKENWDINYWLKEQEKTEINNLDSDTNYDITINLIKELNSLTTIWWKQDADKSKWFSRIDSIFTRTYVPEWTLRWFNFEKFKNNVD